MVGFSPSQPRRAKTRFASGKAPGLMMRGAYTAVREHGKGPRTQLVAIFNTPTMSKQ